jgi:hypothetical protein
METGSDASLLIFNLPQRPHATETTLGDPHFAGPNHGPHDVPRPQPDVAGALADAAPALTSLLAQRSAAP